MYFPQVSSFLFYKWDKFFLCNVYFLFIFNVLQIFSFLFIDTHCTGKFLKCLQVLKLVEPKIKTFKIPVSGNQRTQLLIFINKTEFNFHTIPLKFDIFNTSRAVSPVCRSCQIAQFSLKIHSFFFYPVKGGEYRANLPETSSPNWILHQS